MQTIPKTIQLGVIVLALQLLRELKFPGLRVLSPLARLLGVSRKAGYEAARRVRRRLEAQHEVSGEAKPPRELLSLRIHNQILCYERDHRHVRFQRGARHLPPEARSLCVRILRDFRGDLSLEEVASLIGVPASNLRRWEKSAEADGNFPPKKDLRGKHRRAGPKDVQRVRELFKGLGGALSLEAFSELYNDKHPDRPLDRRTITRILQREDLVEVSAPDRAPPYHSGFQVYFPGAQASLDAKEFPVTFTGSGEETVVLKKEFAVDIASLAVVGHAIGKEETAEGVQRVVVQAREECSSILAILSDNGSANHSADVRRVVEAADTLGQIFSFPYHPQTNGHIEGFFGQVSGIVGDIRIDDSSRETIAASVVEIISGVYVHFHNHSPRQRLGGKSPLEYLRSYAPRPEETEAARESLRKQKARSEASRRTNPRLDDPRFGVLVERIVGLGVGVSKEEAAKSLLPYDHAVIESARNAFVVQSQRDGFQESKRTFRYFMGIVCKKQKEVDSARLQTEIGRQKTSEHLRLAEKHQRQIQKEEAEEEKLLETQPEEVILTYADMLLRAQLRWAKDLFLARLRRGLEALRSLNRASQATCERLVSIIRSWGQYGEDLKNQLLGILAPEFGRICASP